MKTSRRVAVAAGRAVVGVVALACLGVLSASPADAAEDDPRLPAIRVLSSRPDAITGTDVLLEVVPPAGMAASEVKVMLNGVEVAGSLLPVDATGTRRVGLVSGLNAGRNAVRASAKTGAVDRQLTSYPLDGPVLSGPQQKPWTCQTGDFPLPDGSKLGPSLDANCNAATKITYLYMPVGATAFKALPSMSAVPADARRTTTTDGRTVNYIVRLETGTINRSIYQLAVLHDPTADPAIGPTAGYNGWNRRLIYTFGGSATAGYVQGLLTGGVMNDLMLSQGFAVASSTLNVLGNNANDVLSAETLSMVKEKFIKSFGVPLYTMGWGSSGGAMQQHLIANNYPGLLDGLAPTNSWVDLITVVPSSNDCSLLTRVFNSGQQQWSPAQKTAVTGFRDYTTCVGAEAQVTNGLSWEKTFSPYWMLAKRGDLLYNAGGIELTNCLSGLPTSLIYDPKTNPTGARCDVYSAMLNLLGVDASTGFAARVNDNVGVQYGLKAFQSGAISAEQFVALNEQIGGYDPDGNIQPARMSASVSGLQAAYAFGRVNDARNLASVPIIDYRLYLDPDIHNASRSITTRERIVRASGSAPNHVILRGPNLPPIVLRAMDAWLTGIATDKKSYPNQTAKAEANKPAGLADACYTATGERVVQRADLDNTGPCGALYPYFSNPRLVAGAPLADDVLKCRLKAIQRADYPGMNDAQFARLSAVFSTGVCDFSGPSVGYRPIQSTWLRYSAPGQAAALPARP